MKNRELKREKNMPSFNESLMSEGSDSTLFTQRERLRADYKWISDHRESLAEEFLNKYIAVKDKKVVASDNDAYGLLKQLRATGKKPDKFAMEYFSEHPVCYLL